METFIYTIIFIIGTFFGSFFTLAVYRIPKKEDILIKHSYCPNCNHKLGFFDLFPVLSYVLLGGKCRYCKNKIRPRYLILELLSGFAFLILAIGIKLDVLNINSIINAIFLLIYVSILFIIAGIDKENRNINKNVVIIGIIIEVLYIIYQYALKKLNVYQYVMYFGLFILTFITLKIIIKNNERREQIMQIIYLSLYQIVYGGIDIYIITLMLSLITIMVYKVLSNSKKIQVPIGFVLSASNILVIAILNIIVNYIL